MLNLLTNAIKFTPQGGQVTLKIGWTSAGGQYVAIKDTGPGIPEEEIAVVMSSFGRGTLAQKNAERGHRPRPAHRQGPRRSAWRNVQAESRVREGTEAIVVFPPERVMNALPKFEEEDETPHYVGERRRNAAA